MQKLRDRQKNTVLFEGKYIPIEQYLLLDKAIAVEKHNWWKKADPQAKLSLADHDRLSANSIALSVAVKGKAIRINAVGIKALPFMIEARQSKWASLVSEIERELVSQPYKFGDFADELMRVRSKINLHWQKLRQENECRELVVRATLTDHHSILSKQEECWLLFDLYPSNKDTENVFLADIRAREANPLMNRTFEEIPQFIAPHPELAEALFDPPRVAGRNGAPKVIVQADKLTNAKREDLYNFGVNDNRKVKQHQVESVRVEAVDNSIFGSKDLFQSNGQFKIARFVFDRIQMGTVFNFDELHLILGDIAKEIGESYPGSFCVFTLAEGKFGSWEKGEVHTVIELAVGKR
jgi:hypothetical protein